MTRQLETTFLVPNLHCPTCSSHIQEALNRLQPQPLSIVTSIIAHTVTVGHSSALSILAVAKALDEAGFEVFDVVPDPSALSLAEHDKSSLLEHRVPSSAFELAMKKWIPSASNVDDERRQRHIENCGLCRTQSLSTSTSGRSSLPSTVNDREGGEKVRVVVSSAASSSTLYKATLAIEGMTCSSCVGSLTRVLEALAWVQSANINLINHSACVILKEEGRVHETLEAIEGAGFVVTAQTVEPFESDLDHGLPKCSPMWEASIAIEGMTCTSCVNSITSVLKDVNRVRKVEVNLLSNSALVTFEGNNGPEQIHTILSSIEDVGFDAKLDRLTNLAAKSLRKSRRQVAIQVKGMYCEHCPPKIAVALQAIGDDSIEIEKLPTIRDPILRIAYTPNAPRLTIRQILRAISDAEADFEPTIYKPVSLEERSKRMQKREQLHMLYRFILALVAAIPSLVIGIVYMSLVSTTDPNRLYLEQRLHGITRAEIALFVIATPVYFFAADVFHRRTIKELRALWRPGSRVPLLRRFYRFGSMNMLISFGTTVAYFASIAQLGVAASHPTMDNAAMDETYFDSVVFLTMFLLLGRLIEAYSKAKTGNAVAELGKLRPSHASLISEDGEINTLTELLDVGDIVRVPQGASPPFDGVIVEGQALNFDESSLTGESRLVSKQNGDEVFSGTINKGNPASVRLTRVSGDSMLDQIIAVVREGQARRAPVERVADAITGYFVPFVTLIAIVTWIVWITLGTTGVLPEDYLANAVGGWPFWSLKFAIAVFVVACPCGIGLASPTALFVGGGLAAQNGILVKGGGEAFQEASGLDCIVFDKTGTLTEGGEPKVTDHEFMPKSETSLDQPRLLALVMATEAQSTHPIAKSLTAFCRPLASCSIRIQDASEIPGKGMFARANLDDRIVEVIAGSESLLTDYGVTAGTTALETLEQWKSQGKSIAMVAIKSEDTAGWKLVAMFAISDPPRPEAKFVVESLQKAGIDVWMLSGDNQRTASAVGAQVGILESKIIAGVLPSQKAEKIKYLQQSLSKKQRSWSLFRQVFPSKNPTPTSQRATIAMVGDGINDSPALTTADVGIAIGSGSDVAISSAAFVLVSSELTSLLTLIHLSRAVFQRIKINFGWALVYNCLALPIAAGVLYPLKSNSGSHIRLDPVWASLAMALSSISVVCSSLLLRSRLPWVGFRSRRRIR